MKSESTTWKRFTALSLKFNRICALFLMVFSPIYFLSVPLKLYFKHAIPRWDLVFDIICAIFFMSGSVFMYFSRKTWLTTIFSGIALGMWYWLPGAWINHHYDRMIAQFPITYFLIMFFVLLFLLNFLLSLTMWVGTTIIALKNSGFQLFTGIKNMFVPRKIPKKQLVTVALGVVLLLPGILTLTEVFQPAVPIRPGNHTVKFNFWAHSSLDMYSPEEISEMNEHRVNLDIGIYLTPENIKVLKEFEDAMPDITYRVTISQSEIAEMPNRVRNVTELLLIYEANGTLDQWIGFAFDIEGHSYNWYYSFEEPLKVIDVWDEVFDYLDAKSIERGKVIDTECVHSYEYAVDELFDGDLDLQIIEGQIAYSPRRFTKYAPMIYRCWPAGSPPYGSERSIFDESWKWGSSYMIYSRLTAMSATVSPDQLGIYLGITNTSCYGRDIPQEERISWGEATGEDNLIRDILVAKHFGIEEVTFFLQFTFSEADGYTFGGLFDSYGPGILDRIDQEVNQAPPEEFMIFYDHSDARTTEEISRDYMGDFQTLSLKYIMLFVWTLFIVLEITGPDKIQAFLGKFTSIKERK